MKKLLALLLAACLLMGCAYAASEEDILTCGDFAYVLREDNSAELVEYIGEASDIFIPNELDGHPVLAVMGNPFWQDAIHVNWFTLSVREDHPYLEIIDGVLFGKTDRMLICYPPLLYGSEYSIPQGTERIADCAFEFCSSLTTVWIPDSVTDIGVLAFHDCRGLTRVTIPGSVARIGEDAFWRCEHLAEVMIQDGAGCIGERAFEGCTGLTAMTIPGSVTSIGDYAFADCSGLTALTIRDGVVRIGDGAFTGCSLTTVTIPNSIVEIGAGPFGSCPALTEIHVQPGNPAYTAADGILFTRDESVLVQYPAGRQGDAYAIPDSVTRIGAFAFECCSCLTEVTIPASVAQIEIGAFSHCPDLTLTITPGSYAEQYCREQGIPYEYAK